MRSPWKCTFSFSYHDSLHQPFFVTFHNTGQMWCYLTWFTLCFSYETINFIHNLFLHLANVHWAPAGVPGNILRILGGFRRTLAFSLNDKVNQLAFATKLTTRTSVVYLFSLWVCRSSGRFFWQRLFWMGLHRISQRADGVAQHWFINEDPPGGFSSIWYLQFQFVWACSDRNSTTPRGKVEE